jgi:aspartate/methionine/tyrosine aminotransferase
VPATRTDEAWALALLERGVAVHPGHFYDFAAGEHLVLSLIVESATFAAGLDAIAAELRAG